MLVRLATHVRNARATRLAREAVDVAGLGTVLLDAQGRISWRSPQAARWLTSAFGMASPDSETRALRWLQSATQATEIEVRLPDQSRLLARHLGHSGVAESVLVLQVAPYRADATASMRMPDVPLTARETEVLSWLAKGKTNRDIADILGMSHRTVNKHLEHIFQKLGVETRSAATAIAGKLWMSG